MAPKARKADPNKVVIFKPDLCGHCGACVAVCVFDSLVLYRTGIAVDMNTCILCDACVRTCPTFALEITNGKQQLSH
jgi:NAD-dependent dihydropyrimidine dehydrogenase PreA subunit